MPSVAANAPTKPAFLYPVNVAQLMAIGPGVDSAMTGHIHHFIVGNPLFSFHAVVFNHRNHGIATAKGEQTNLCKSRNKSSKIFILVRPPSGTHIGRSSYLGQR